ncbi:hypothetical protein AGMMS49983_12250 [Clostridia bacterium]|nr:hypothetical protein AGMMS49983_12250 [Clostridia bacterium]
MRERCDNAAKQGFENCIPGCQRIFNYQPEVYETVLTFYVQETPIGQQAVGQLPNEGNIQLSQRVYSARGGHCRPWHCCPIPVIADAVLSFIAGTVLSLRAEPAPGTDPAPRNDTVFAQSI